MKPKGKSRKDIIILLLVLMLVSFSIGMLHAMPEKGARFTKRQIEQALSPQIIAGDVSKVAFGISQLSPAQQRSVMKDILYNTRSPLNQWQKADVLFNVMIKAPFAERESFLKILPNTLAWAKFPLLYAAGHNHNETVIPSIVQWLEKNDKKNLIFYSLYCTVLFNDPDALTMLLSHGVSITPGVAKNLLWLAVEKNRAAAFVPILKKAGADLEAVKDGRTLLIKATENNNLPLVQELVSQGVSINAIPDVAVGSALQVAIRKGFTPIELLFRKKGARE